MKKLLFVFFILFNLNLFAWKTISIVDEFDEPTGKIAIKQYDENGSSMVIYENKFIVFFSKNYIGKKSGYQSSLIKAKIDNNPPLMFNGTVASFDDNIISILEPEGYPLIEKMKTGKILKVSMEKYNGDTILLKFDLKDFNKYLNILNENSK